MTASISDRLVGRIQTSPLTSASDWRPVPQAVRDETVRTAAEAALGVIGMPVDETILELAEHNLEPRATAWALSVVAAVRSLPAELRLAVYGTEDGGVTIEVESAQTSREVTFAVPVDGSRRFFSATERGELRMTGAVTLDVAVRNLARWVGGEGAEPLAVGLTLPTRLRAKGLR